MNNEQLTMSNDQLTMSNAQLHPYSPNKILDRIYRINRKPITTHQINTDDKIFCFAKNFITFLINTEKQITKYVGTGRNLSDTKEKH